MQRGTFDAGRLCAGSVTNYLATFYTHFGAMRFNKYCGEKGMPAKMAPVPRELSSSCGVCVRFEAACAPKTVEHDDMERCYIINSDGTFLQTEG